MDQYNQEERRHDRDEPDTQGPPRSGAPSQFPWQESAEGDRPPQVWTEPSAEKSAGGTALPGDRPDGRRNPLAIAGFVLSIVMWVTVPIPILSVVLWILALTFSSIGLSRSRRLGMPHKGLAIAGLCLSLAGVVIVVLFILFLAGAAVLSAA